MGIENGMASETIIEKLYRVLLERKKAQPEESYVASLYHKGTSHICDKVTEEAAETIAEALKGDKDRLGEESADLLFHLMVLWADQDLTPDDVFTILQRRFGLSGHVEKESRKS